MTLFKILTQEGLLQEEVKEVEKAEEVKQDDEKVDLKTEE